MTRLTGEILGEIANKVRVERSSSLSEAGAAFDLDDMTHSVRASRRLMRSTLKSLPESAFTVQPPAGGEDAWSAGQVIAHLSNSQASMSGAVRRLLAMPDAPAGQRYDMDDPATLPTRDEAIAILSQTETGFDSFVASIPADGDLAKTLPHDRFGEMSTKGWLMLMALHESDHLRQIRALAD